MFKIAFTGSSHVAGVGWNLPEEQDLMWTNLVHKNCFSDLICVNASIPGCSNSDIFKQSIELIASNDNLECLICSWVDVPRYTFSAGFELYPTDIKFVIGHSNGDIKLSTGTIPKKYIENLQNRFLTLHHYHHEIKLIIEYVNVINKLCKQKNIKVYHVNDACPWDEKYFDCLTDVFPEAYTEFTKTNILNVVNRNDEEIFKLYTKLHNEYDLAGGIRQSSWINLYSSWFNNQIDANHDNVHPGQQSNFNYYTIVSNFLKSQ